MADSIHYEEGISKNNNMLMFIGSFFYLANLIYYAYPAMGKLGLVQPSDTSVIVRDFLEKKLFLFASPYVTLLIALTLIGLFVWGNRKTKTLKYSPPKLMRVILPIMVKYDIHPKFEYEQTTNKNGLPCLEKKRERVEGQVALCLGLFLVIFSVLPLILFSETSVFYTLGYLLYVVFSAFGFAYFILGANLIHSMVKDYEDEDDDANNNVQESFKQEMEIQENEYSVNWRTKFKYHGKTYDGWINCINPFRAVQVIGTPGSGKSFAIINEFIRQHMKKNFCMYCYDFKFPDLSLIVYNNMLQYKDSFRRRYGIEPKFCVINFDDPRKSMRCNPIRHDFLKEITDAYDSAYTIMLNLNKSWAQKQGDFFVESPINYLTSCIWYLKKVKGGKYCTLPHVVQLVNESYTDVIPLMSAYPELNNYMAAFFEAWEGGAQDQLQGQIASVRIPLSRISSPQLYWVMSGDDFTLDLNNPEDPKVLCVGNNPEKKDIYATALGLYNGRIVKIINKKHQHPITLIIDELPTMYFRGLDNLIATARSNYIATVLGYQDFSQLKRDYGDKEANAIINTVGNLFSGMVTGETAKALEAEFGKNKQKRKSVSYSDNGESYSISEQNDTLIPASKIATLSQGNFVGKVTDNVGENIVEKRFNAQIQIDIPLVKREEKHYRPLPTFWNFDTPSVACKLCKKMIDYCEDSRTFLTNDILVKNNLATIDDFKQLLDQGKDINIKKVISLLFTSEYKNQEGKYDYMVADTLYRFAKEILKAVMIHEGDLKAAAGKLLSFKSRLNKEKATEEFCNTAINSIKTFIKEAYDWIELETNANIPFGCITIKAKIAEFNNKVIQFQKGSLNGDLSDTVELTIRKYIESLRSVLNPYVEIKAELAKIRDDKMNEVLNKNSDKICQDIKMLINDMLGVLYHENNSLWKRRLQVLKKEKFEADELDAIGLHKEANELRLKQQANE